MSVKVTTNASELKKEIAERLKAYQRDMKLQVFRALSLLEAEIMQNIRSKSGLKVRSGSLLNSIPASKKVTVESDGTVTGQIGPQGIPYAAIHEFGGKTAPHRIEPRNAKVLALQIGGKDVFARFVNHPGSNVPQRSYLRTALAAKQDEIMSTFGIFIATTFDDFKK